MSCFYWDVSVGAGAGVWGSSRQMKDTTDVYFVLTEHSPLLSLPLYIAVALPALPRRRAPRERGSAGISPGPPRGRGGHGEQPGPSPFGVTPAPLVPAEPGAAHAVCLVLLLRGGPGARSPPPSPSMFVVINPWSSPASPCAPGGAGG